MNPTINLTQYVDALNPAVFGKSLHPPKWMVAIASKELRRPITLIRENTHRKVSYYLDFHVRDGYHIGTTIIMRVTTEVKCDWVLAILLHEIAHANTSYQHSERFIAEALRLYKKYGLLRKVATGHLNEYNAVAVAARKMIRDDKKARKDEVAA